MFTKQNYQFLKKQEFWNKHNEHLKLFTAKPSYFRVLLFFRQQRAGGEIKF